MSTPGAKAGPSESSASTPMSPQRTPTTLPSSIRASAPEKPGNTSTSRASARWPSICTSMPWEMMKLPWLLDWGGVGRRTARFLVSSRNSSLVAGTQIPGGLSRQSGSSASRASGCITAPDRAWTPSSEALSSRHTVRSGSICFRRMAQASPAGPPPTMATSYSIWSRSVIPVSCGWPAGEWVRMSDLAWTRAWPGPPRGQKIGCTRQGRCSRIF